MLKLDSSKARKELKWNNKWGLKNQLKKLLIGTFPVQMVRICMISQANKLKIHGIMNKFSLNPSSIEGLTIIARKPAIDIGAIRQTILS